MMTIQMWRWWTKNSTHRRFFMLRSAKIQPRRLRQHHVQNSSLFDYWKEISVIALTTVLEFEEEEQQKKGIED